MSLTDYWRAGKLNGCFWCRHPDGHIEAHKLDNLRHENYMDIEVLAPCNYAHLVDLTEKVKQLKDKVEWEIGKNEALEKQLTEAKEGIKKGRKALELMCDRNDELFALLKECRTLCKEMIKVNRLYIQGKCICPCKESITDILTRINAALGKNERHDNG